MAVENPNDIPDNTVGIDPVSGNEIPMGSTAENVRDDIPSMLSEGEIVVPADVVNYYGVKFFEDLRADAKKGYAAMDADGRIGGQPIEEPPVMGADIDIALTMEDLEATDTMGAAEPEEAFLGKFFAGIKESNKKAAQQAVRNKVEAAKKRGSVNKIKSGQSSKKKYKNRAEEMMDKLFGGGSKDDRKKSYTKPEKKKSGAKLDFGFGGNPMERAARKYDTGTTPEKKEAGKVEEAYTGENLRGDKGFGERFMEGLGFDEGGFANKGGFDMEAAMDYGLGSSPLLEMREYMNDVGHRIFITFINGEPQMAIPDGYFPVGEAQAQQPVTEETQQQKQDDGGGSGGPVIEPNDFDYKELTMDELQEEVSNVVKPSITIIDKIGKALHGNLLIKEIDRRLAAEDVPIYEQEYLENLKIVAANPEPSILQKGIAALTGQKLDKPDVPNLTGPTYDELPNEYGVVEAYTPEINDGMSGVPNPPKVTSEPLVPGTGKTLDDILSQPTKSSAMDDLQDLADELTKPQVRGSTRLEKDSQRRRDRQEQNKNLRGKSTARKTDEAKSATRGLGTTDKKGGAALDSRFGISGLEKGGLASKKGKKKKSK